MRRSLRTPRARCLLAAVALAGATGCGNVLGVDAYDTRGSGGSGAAGACVADRDPSFAAPSALTIRNGAGRGANVAAHGETLFVSGALFSSVGLSFTDGATLTSPDGDGVYVASLVPGAAAPHRFSVALRPTGGPGSAAALAQALVRDGRDGPVTGVAVVGEFTGTIAFAAGAGAVAPQSAHAGSLDAFVAMVDPDGTPRWLRGFGDAGEQRALGAVIDGQGHLVVALHGDGVFDFGPGCPADAGGGAGIFLAAFDPQDGACVWSAAFPTGYLRQPLHLKPIALGYSPADDTLVLAGATRGSSWFGPSDGMDRIFVLRVGPDHAPRPPTLLGGESAEFGERWAEAVAADGCGNVYFGGGFRNDLEIGGELRRTSASHRDDDDEADAVVCKIAPDGSVVWCRVLAASGAQMITDLAADGGVVAVAGYLDHSGPVDLGGLVMTPDAGSRDGFVAALIDRGDGAAPALGRALGDDGAREQDASGVAVDASGRVAVTGTFFGGLRHAAPPGGELLAGGYAPFILSFAPAP